MRISRMVEGNLYKIKPHIHVYPNDARTGPNSSYPILGGFRESDRKDVSSSFPPFVYLGHNRETWSYAMQHTNKIHYV